MILLRNLKETLEENLGNNYPYPMNRNGTQKEMTRNLKKKLQEMERTGKQLRLE